MKRIISVLLTVSLLFAMLAVSASAQETGQLKQDISKATVNVDNAEFIGVPVQPDVSVYLDGSSLVAGTDYVVVYENNVNIGTAIARVIGKGKYCGSVEKSFQITYGDTTVTMPGAYNGSATGDLNDQVYYTEGYLSPGLFGGYTDCNTLHEAYYALYRMDGETPVLIREEEKEEGVHNDTMFTYDFSSVYNSKNEGETYILSYAWMTRYYDVYSGVIVMHIPAKVAAATSMKVEKLPDVGNYRTQYVTYYSEDGALELPKWSTSDASVATVDDGTVTFKKPGSVTITAKCGKLSDSVTLTASVQDLSKGLLTAYTAEDGASVYYDGYLLEEGVDYTTQTRTEGFTTEVTVTGINFFEGQLTREFVGDVCVHNFDNSCDSTCNSCDYTRETEHHYGTNWRRDPENHWHGCTVCGDKIDLAAHIVTPEEPEVCTVCGPLKVAGDLDGSCEVDEDDVIYLLQHVLMPEDFPVSQPVDYDHNDTIDEDDVIYLLQHVLMPEDFPLN